MIRSAEKRSIGAALPARGIAAIRLGTGGIADKPITIASGHVGAVVAAISFTNAANLVVSATAAKSQFAFWPPGNELQNASAQGAPVHVTYRDGTTETRLLDLLSSSEKSSMGDSNACPPLDGAVHGSAKEQPQTTPRFTLHQLPHESHLVLLSEAPAALIGTNRRDIVNF